jgi:hypothetical protein
MNRVRCLVTLVCVVISLLPAGTAFAYWSAVGANSGQAQTDTLDQAAPPTTTVTGAYVNLSWLASTTGTGHAVAGYQILRYPAASGGTGVTPGGSCAGNSSGIVTSTTCTDQSATPGTWYYTVNPVLNSWAGGESSPRAAATVAPAALAFGTSSLTVPGSLTSGGISGFRPNETVTFRLDTTTGTVLTSTPSSITTNGNGAATGLSVAIPAGVAQGSHAVHAVGGLGSQASTTFSVTNSGTASFSDSVLRTLPAALSGGSLDYFHAGGPVHFYLDATSGTPLTVTGGPDGTTVTASSNGTASGFSVTIPTGTSNGQHTVWAVDGLGAQASFVIGVGPDTFALTWPAGTTNLTAGTTYTLTIAATLPTGQADTAYTGAHTLTFAGPSASPSPKNKKPSYNGSTGSSGTSVTTSVTFTGGVATVPVILYRAEAATLTVTDNSAPTVTGSRLTTVIPAAASYLCVTSNPSCTAGSTITIPRDSSWSSYVDVYDAHGNAANTGTAATTVSVTLSGQGSVAPSSLTIPAGTAQSSGRFTYTAPHPNNQSGTVTVSASGLTSATVIIGT